MRAVVLFVLSMALAGCASKTLADCGLSVHAPSRAIDEGWRFDVKEIVGTPRSLDDVGYRFLNRTDEGIQQVVFEGNVGALARAGNNTLRFLDAANNSQLNVGDAFVVKVLMQMTLQLTQGTSIIGTSQGCE